MSFLWGLCVPILCYEFICSCLVISSISSINPFLISSWSFFNLDICASWVDTSYSFCLTSLLLNSSSLSEYLVWARLSSRRRSSMSRYTSLLFYSILRWDLSSLLFYSTPLLLTWVMMFSISFIYAYWLCLNTSFSTYNFFISVCNLLFYCYKDSWLLIDSLEWMFSSLLLFLTTFYSLSNTFSSTF